MPLLMLTFGISFDKDFAGTDFEGDLACTERDFCAAGMNELI